MKRQENRAVIAWREAASAGLFSSADSAYIKNSRPPSNAPTCGQSRTVDKPYAISVYYGKIEKKQGGFSYDDADG